MRKGQKLFKHKETERSVVILDNTITRMQFMRLGKQTRINKLVRFFNSKDDPEWEKTGEQCILNRIAPDN